MFIQVIHGRTDDPKALRAATERWVAELSPGATGWLGTTAGVTADGRFIAAVRFESEEAARRNSERPQQDQWWAETSKLLTSEVHFHNSGDVEMGMGGGSDAAGFVQFMHGRARDVDRLKELSSGSGDDIAKLRPDILGMSASYSDDGTSTQAIYFRSEREAREYEAKEPPPEVAARLGEMMSLVEDLVYYDLLDPWLHSPR